MSDSETDREWTEKEWREFEEDNKQGRSLFYKTTGGCAGLGLAGGGALTLATGGSLTAAFTVAAVCAVVPGAVMAALGGIAYGASYWINRPDGPKPHHN
jgi:hypothetical protein